MAISLDKSGSIDTHERLRNFGRLMLLLNRSENAVGAYFFHFLKWTLVVIEKSTGHAAGNCLQLLVLFCSSDRRLVKFLTRLVVVKDRLIPIDPIGYSWPLLLYDRPIVEQVIQEVWRSLESHRVHMHL
jgi:hypothetical protein